MRSEHLQEEEARKAAEEAERARQEQAAAQAAAVEPEESEDDINWEDMDLDTVKLPGTKKEEPSAPEPAKRPAKEDEVISLKPAAMHHACTAKSSKIWLELEIDTFALHCRLLRLQMQLRSRSRLLRRKPRRKWKTRKRRRRKTRRRKTRRMRTKSLKKEVRMSQKRSLLKRSHQMR